MPYIRTKVKRRFGGTYSLRHQGHHSCHLISHWYVVVCMFDPKIRRKKTDISGEHVASIFTVKDYAKMLRTKRSCISQSAERCNTISGFTVSSLFLLITLSHLQLWCNYSQSVLNLKSNKFWNITPSSPIKANRRS
jgi:hypothetical protein